MKKAFAAFLMLFLVLTPFFAPMSLAASEAASRNIVIQSTEGSDIILTKGTDKTYTAKKGVRLASGYTLTTGKQSYVWLKLDNNSIVKMDESTKLDISKASNRELKLTVINGSISFNADKQKEDDKTSVTAGNSTMGLRGTLFTVTYLDGDMQVVLLEGELECETPDGDYILEEGHVLEVSGQRIDAEGVDETSQIYRPWRGGGASGRPKPCWV